MQYNPLLSDFDTPYQTIPFCKVDTGHFEPAITQLINDTKEAVEAIIENNAAPGFYNVIEALEETGRRLSVVTHTLFNLNHAATSPEIQGLTAKMSAVLTDFRNSINHNKDLFKKVQEVYKTIDKQKLRNDQVKLLNDTYKSFVRNGANLSDTDKKHFQDVTKELSSLQIEFNQHVLSETNQYILHFTNSGDIAGIPQEYIDKAKHEAKNRQLEGWVFTLQHPSFIPFMKYAVNRTKRKELWYASATKCTKGGHSNMAIVEKIVNKRLELAQILGYKSFAHYALEERMAKTPEKVNSFLTDLLKASKKLATKDMDDLSAFAQSKSFSDNLMPWDVMYWLDKLKQERYHYNDEETRPYFQLHKVVDGIFNLAENLFEIKIKEITEPDVYHPDVKVYRVDNEPGELQAILYIDFFPRNNKQNGAWMTEFREQYVDGNKKIHPHVSLVLNLNTPLNDTPALLTHNEVTTLMHEFGHALHGMLSNVQYASQSGTNVYRDFVELPSQLFENFAYQKEWLLQVSSHYKSGDKIPEALVDKIIQSRVFFEGYSTFRQLSFAFLDMAWHSITDKYSGNPLAFEQKATENTRLLPTIEGTGMSPSFSHIFGGGYASGYYSYKWSEVLEADAFSVFEENGVFNKSVAKKFKQYILEKGGSESPEALYKAFRGKEPTVDALLNRIGAKI